MYTVFTLSFGYAAHDIFAAQARAVLLCTPRNHWFAKYKQACRWMMQAGDHNPGTHSFQTPNTRCWFPETLITNSQVLHACTSNAWSVTSLDLPASPAAASLGPHLHVCKPTKQPGNHQASIILRAEQAIGFEQPAPVLG